MSKFIPQKAVVREMNKHARNKEKQNKEQSNQDTYKDTAFHQAADYIFSNASKNYSLSVDEEKPTAEAACRSDS